jgi:lipopolysaccharide heptosyltransferase II
LSWGRPRRLLCVRLDSIGDVLMTTPALRACKETFGCRITLLTSAAGAAVAPLVPEIDEAIVFTAPWMKAAGASRAQDEAMIHRLARGRFDAAVIFTVYSQSPLPAAYLGYLAGIPLRLAHCHENPYDLLTHWVRDPEPAQRVRHEVERQLDLVSTVGARTADTALSFRVPAKARGRIETLLMELPAPLVVVHPGATAASRRYPPEQYAAAVDLLIDEAQCTAIFTGDATEAPLVEGIVARMRHPARSLAGKLVLSELGALIERADLLISNNTAPAHIAAALGTPVVDLYALTNPQHTPWRVPSRVLFHDVPCRNCYKSICPLGHHDCLRGVAPERVAQAARDLLMTREVAA